MESIGQYLRRIREEHGLSVGEVARLTRISPGYIQALEENRLEKFPGEVFARGFVRVYGRCLGLDDEDTMTRFSQSAQAFFQRRDESQRHSEQTLELQNSRRKLQGRIAQVAVVAVLGLAILTVYSMNARRSTDKEGGFDSRPSPPAQETSTAPETPLEQAEPAVNKPALNEAEPKPANVPIAPEAVTPENTKPPAALKPPVLPNPQAVPKPPAETKTKPPVEKLPLIVNVPGESPAPAASQTPSAPAGHPVPPAPLAPVVSSAPVGDLVLVIEAVESSWVSARIDGGDTKEVFLQPGQKVTWKASDHFLVSFGNAGGVKIQFNGKSLPPFGPKGAVVKDVKITRE
ncbi:MAG: helix-turn-helix domain-containing protein [Nitrospirae bacterium]|nr:helix-turn-helix domain-containing protein [Nitrospirota bacterium]